MRKIRIICCSLLCTRILEKLCPLFWIEKFCGELRCKFLVCESRLIIPFHEVYAIISSF